MRTPNDEAGPRGHPIARWAIASTDRGRRHEKGTGVLRECPVCAPRSLDGDSGGSRAHPECVGAPRALPYNQRSPPNIQGLRVAVITGKRASDAASDVWLASTRNLPPSWATSTT